MDLYYYKITRPKDKDSNYEIGRRPIFIKGITCECIETPDINFLNSCIAEALTKHNIDPQESYGTYCYDFTCDKPYIGVYNEDTLKEFKRLNNNVNDSYGMNDSARVECNYKLFNDFVEKVDNDSSYWKDTMFFSGIPLINEYKLLCNHEEVNYARKPFRSIADKNSEAYLMLLDNAKGDFESSFIIFDKDTEIVFRQLIRLIEDQDMIKQLNTMLPIADNHIISINW